jgi:hypothetical protein
MTTARTNPEHHALAAGNPDQVTRADSRASKLFEKDHAYAARLVQLPTAIRSVVRSTIVMNAPDQVSSNIQEDDGIKAGIVTQPRTRKRPIE